MTACEEQNRTMQIGVLSDTHDAHDNTRAALELFRERGIKRLIHCGDLTSPETLLLFAGWDVTFALGNMDRGVADLAEAAKRIGLAPPQRMQELEINGVRIGVTHGDDANLLYRMMFSGRFTFICHGHTHERRNEHRTAYEVRLINPGALGGSCPQARSIALLDTETKAVEFIEFPDWC
jgi:putative phosphoesterase